MHIENALRWLGTTFCMTSLAPLTRAQIPNAVYLEVPAFPEIARATKTQGQARFELQISDTGSVESIKELKPFPHINKMLNTILSNSISKWRFVPGNSHTLQIEINIVLLPLHSKPDDERTVFEFPNKITIYKRMLMIEKGRGN